MRTRGENQRFLIVFSLQYSGEQTPLLKWPSSCSWQTFVLCQKDKNRSTKRPASDYQKDTGYVYVCMYVYMYVCIYVRMYVCMYVQLIMLSRK